MKFAATILLLFLVTAPFSPAYADPDDYYDDPVDQYEDRSSLRWDEIHRRQQENTDELFDSMERSREEQNQAMKRKREEEEREREFEARLKKEREEADRQARLRYYEPPKRYDPLESRYNNSRSSRDPLDESPFSRGRTPSAGQAVLRQLETID